MRPDLRILCAIVISLTIPSTAHALDVVSPADGEEVGGRSAFILDFSSGSLVIELSEEPEVLEGGLRPGAFVDTADSDFGFFGGTDGPDGEYTWDGRRIHAGKYFWHASLTSYEDNVLDDGWGPIRTLIVRDEPIEFEGWTLRSRRTGRMGCQKRYRYAYRIGGTIGWNDNAKEPVADYAIGLKAGSGSGVQALVLRGQLEGTGSFDHRVCTNHRTARLTISLRDPDGHVTAGPAKRLTLRL